MKNKHTLICGDNVSEMKQLPENSADACITDPPYFLSMLCGKK